tara:strand:+ start:103 stop:213 length:111 start_codon:yes stop_codon:yes gene_type:complete
VPTLNADAVAIPVVKLAFKALPLHVMLATTILGVPC